MSLYAALPSGWSTIGAYSDSPTNNGPLNRASRLTGEARHRAYGELDVQISRDAAPMLPVAVVSQPTFVSARVGCIVLTPMLDLTAVERAHH